MKRNIQLKRMYFVTGKANTDGEVPDLATVLLGQWAGYTAKMFSVLVLLGAVIVYWILMSNFLYHSVDYVYGKQANYTLQCVHVISLEQTVMQYSQIE
jgi:hypothetical protein